MRTGKRTRTDPVRGAGGDRFRTAGLRAVCTLITLLLWWGAGRNARAEAFFDYLYIEANEGDSSGGHAALRFGGETFHFQHETPGILRLRRIDSDAFVNL
jgi:hypothetical protein